jgi:DNA repair exonuclease SbcCD ATPase subunit
VAINGRAAREESLALEHYRAAIHECFRALLPHAHLDDIEIDPSSGAVNVTDGLLRRRSLPAVRPALYLSSGQTNALALAVFFGIALRQTVANLDFLLLDEPIQNLDDVHFLALITLLKRTALSRQILLSTADANVAEIMRRQMKSGWTDSEDGYVEYEWLTFSPHTGPGVVQRT